jgi:hypothetical protein
MPPSASVRFVPRRYPKTFAALGFVNSAMITIYILSHPSIAIGTPLGQDDRS